MAHDKEKPDLLPCPFCGEYPEIVEITSEDWEGKKHSIACTSKDCTMQPSTYPSCNATYSYYNWNHRADK